MTEPPAGGVATTPPRSHPQRPRRQLRLRPWPAPPPGELLFLRRGRSTEGGGRDRPLVRPRWAGRRQGCSGGITLTDILLSFESISEGFPSPSSWLGKKGRWSIIYSLGEETELWRGEGDLSKVTCQETGKNKIGTQVLTLAMLFLETGVNG